MEYTTRQNASTMPANVTIGSRITIGRIIERGQETNKRVDLNNASLCRHTFVTGSTGSGKSNAVYQMLTELRNSKVPFLIIDPTKGNYKDAFGSLPDVTVFSTSPNVAKLVNLNPFIFPKSIHVLEHVDGLMEVFGACWPMYDAMPALLKDAILKSYEAVGWDLGSSTFDGGRLEFPDFVVLSEQLDDLIGASDLEAGVKSNYRGALLSRARSLTTGLNKYIFTMDQTPYEELFDKSCILDISRVKSAKTKALIMGVVVYALSEYRMDQEAESGSGLSHITVVEEAHNLLKSTTGDATGLMSESVEVITNAIAEMGTHGEGFVIVDQSPSLVDIDAIKNTNTKIILRTSEAGDRIALNGSVGLTDTQKDQIAKLPTDMAFVYQSGWKSPILAMIKRADVDNKPYEPGDLPRLMTRKSARQLITRMLMQPWFAGAPIKQDVLLSAQKVLELNRRSRVRIKDLIEYYEMFGGRLSWHEDELADLRALLGDVLDITDAQLEAAVAKDELMKLVSSRLGDLEQRDLVSVCNVLIFDAGVASHLLRLSIKDEYSPLSSNDAKSMTEEELRYVNTCMYDPFYSERDSNMDLIECIGKLGRSDSLKTLLVDYCKTPAKARMYLYLEVAYRYFGILELVKTFDQKTGNWDEALLTYVSRNYKFTDDANCDLDSSEWIRFSQTMLAAGIIWVKDEYNGSDKTKIMDALWKQHRI